MDNIHLLSELFVNYTFQIVLIGSLVLGITAGSLGAFAVLRRQSLLGDAIAHATLPGVCLAFLITQSKNPLYLLIGAAISGWVGALLIDVITKHTRIKKDAALGIILSVFFGFGIVLITIIQKLPTATKAGLDKFLFGNAATLLYTDVQLMIIFSMIIFSILILFWKEFKLIVFDHEFASSIGLPVNFYNILLTTLIVLTIVIGLQTVGVVLMSALLVAPAAAARQWTDKLSMMVFISAIFGAISGFGGALVSSLMSNMPTGPTIVIFVSFFVIFSLILAPHRGLIWDYIRMTQHRRQIVTTSMLKNLLYFAENHNNPFHPHNISALNAIGRGTQKKTLQDLEKKGWAQQFPDKRWALTPKGLKEAKLLTEAYEGALHGTKRT